MFKMVKAHLIYRLLYSFKTLYLYSSDHTAPLSIHPVDAHKQSTFLTTADILTTKAHCAHAWMESSLSMFAIKSLPSRFFSFF